MSRTFVHLAIVTILALFVFFFRLGVADWRGDVDAHQSQIIQQILAGKGWVLPLRNGLHLPVKPPMFSWVGAASASLRHSGGEILDARLPSALSATLCVIAVYAFAQALAGESVALWAALILITTPQFIVSARDSRVDMLFSAFLTLGLMLAWRVYDGEGGRRTAVSAGLCMGLAILTKGPLALVLAVPIFGTMALLAPPRPGWRALLAPATLVVSIGLPALWYLAASFQQGPAFLRLQLFAENVERLTGGQGKWPLWFYIAPLFVLGFPWTLALPAAAAGESALPSRSRRFLWTWTVVMFVFFSLALGKRQVYILPLRPALAILLAGWLVPQLERWSSLRRTAAPPRAAHGLIGGFVIIALLGLVALRFGLGGIGASDQQWAYWWRLHAQEYFISLAILIVGLGIGVELITRWTWQRRFDLALYALVGTVAVGLTIGLCADAIVRGEALSFRDLAQRVTGDVPPTQAVVFLDVDDDTATTLLYHLRRNVPTVHAVDGVESCTPPRPGAYLISESRWDERTCASDPHWHLIARGGPAIRSHWSQRLVFARYAGSSQPIE